MRPQAQGSDVTLPTLVQHLPRGWRVANLRGRGWVLRDDGGRVLAVTAIASLMVGVLVQVLKRADDRPN